MKLQSRQYLLIVIAITIIVLTINFVIANREKSELQVNLSILEEGLNQLQNGQSIEAEALFQLLVEKYPTNFHILWNYGIALSLNEKYSDALQIYLLAQQHNNFLALNSYFTTQIGRLFYLTEDYHNAQIYLEKSLTLGSTDDNKELATQLLESMVKE